jgi:hypothetical protein
VRIEYRDRFSERKATPAGGCNHGFSVYTRELCYRFIFYLPSRWLLRRFDEGGSFARAAEPIIIKELATQKVYSLQE